MVYYDDRYPNLGDAGRGLETAKRYLEDAQEQVRNDPNDTSAKVSEAIAISRVSLALRETDAKGAVAMSQQALRMLNAIIKSSGTSSLITVSNRVLAAQRLAAAELKAG